MTLNREDREAIVVYRLQRAHDTFAEVKGIVAMKYWHTAANRLYYACYYAVTALLINNNLTAHTHAGVISQLGLHFVSKGVISKEQGKFFKRLFELRQDGDYSDWFDVEEEDILLLLEPAEQFIAKIENIINNGIPQL
jgi:uncharacterized protein (UPF0332 family)